jgi:ketopantoate reductase
MKSSDLSFLVIGAGAIGGITAALMKKRGYDIEIVREARSTADAMKMPIEDY